MHLRRLILPSLIAITCTGCIEISEVIELQADGSGTAHLSVTFPQLGLRWLPGKPTADWLEPNLPRDVKLTSFANSQTQTKLIGDDGKERETPGEAYDIKLAFGNIESLNGIRVQPDVRNKKAATAGSTPGKMRAEVVAAETSAPTIGPFQHLTLKTSEDTLQFRRVVQAARSREAMEADAMSRPGSAAKPQAIDLGKSFHVISILCPGEVLTHNAHEIDGRKLTWRFKLKDLQQQQDRDWIVEFTCRKEAK